MAFISELHYSNAYASNSGITEFLEVKLEPGDDPANFQVAFYNFTGNVGEVVSLDNPDVEVTNLPNGGGFYVIGRPNFNVLLTDPDGGATGVNYEAFALVDTSTNTVVQFWDIGGGTQNIVANDGPAAGATSETIIPPTGPNAATYSIQFQAGDPTTPIFVAATPGAAVCFCGDVLIATPTGLCRVADLQIGTKVQTVDHGDRPVRWIGRQEMTAPALAQNPKLRPIVISAGALGYGLPLRDLRVSRQHRIMVTGQVAQRMFGAEQVLVAAKDLTALPGVYTDTSDQPFSYVHIALDQHELVLTEGIATETLLPGPMALNALDAEEYAELHAIFGADALTTMAETPARPLVAGPRARKLVQRHQRNNIAFVR